jgi:hypothetical protein
MADAENFNLVADDAVSYEIIIPGHEFPELRARYLASSVRKMRQTISGVAKGR